jgi:dTDP-4-dehydrorhamnose reductase
VLLIGATGLLGGELERALAPVCDLVVSARAPGAPVVVDVLDAASIREAIARVRPAVVVNATGYVAVDRAERERAAAWALNAVAPGTLAEACARAGATFVHWSTDYVFDGSVGRAHVETDPVNPLNHYGRTKLAGEEAVRAAGGAHLILRTTWLLAPDRGFLRDMRRRLAAEPEVDVLADQRGSPTWVRSPAEAARDVLLRLAPLAGAAGLDPRAASGVYHLACREPARWLDVALWLKDRWRSPARLVPMSRPRRPDVAVRPAWCALDSARAERVFGVRMPTWREALAACLSGDGIA